MELSDDDVLVPNSFVADMIDCIEDALRYTFWCCLFTMPI